jgi:energy-coupling factor transporter ATP-binding protein EcfA2
MRLKSIDYMQFNGTERQWSLSGLTLGSVNLVVGKNATGKTRTLNIINGLGSLVSGRKKPTELTTGTYRTTFEHDGRLLMYSLDIQDRKVTLEEFRDGDSVLLKRGKDGVGTIYHQKEKKDFEFQTPDTECSVVARVDRIQHPFLEPLAEWGAGVRHYEFGGTMGRPVIALLVKDGPPPDPMDANAVIALFRKGEKDFKGKFVDAVKQDMIKAGYDIEEAGTMQPTDVTVVAPTPVPISPVVLYVKERDLPTVTQQTDMSQGMFRALAVIIHVNYAVVASRPSCIIVDDIGEGIDFDRSCKLINLIRERAKHADVQLILSTNDKFVMNEVPLEEWSLLQRQGGQVRVRNYENSKKEFDYFRYVGMSNFTFFEMDFINGKPRIEEAAAHE